MKRVQPRLSGESGFTLIEILIGISIFAIGMLAVAKMQMATVRNTTLGNVISQATMLANQKMEEVKTTSFDDLVANEVENNLGSRRQCRWYFQSHDNDCDTTRPFRGPMCGRLRFRSNGRPSMGEIAR